MTNRNLGIFILIATIVTQAIWVQSATTYIAGDDKGWARDVDYDAWVRDKKFYVGDEIRFHYDRNKHDILVVSEDAYNRCDNSKPEITMAGCGNNGLRLEAVGTGYCISGRDGDCQAGMKLKVVINPCPALLEGRDAVLKF